jgi:C_GCAxxG_C_C family probable redox protein
MIETKSYYIHMIGGEKLSKAKEAKKQFEKGFSCAPAVLSAYSEQLGLEKELALKVACGFGGGIGRTGRTCGAVTGAIMVIGLTHGQADLGDEESRQKTHKLVKKFIDEFTARHGSIECRQLIGYDLSDSAESKLARKKKVFENKCPSFVYDSACILENVLHLR